MKCCGGYAGAVWKRWASAAGAPLVHPNQTPAEIEGWMLELRRGIRCGVRAR